MTWLGLRCNNDSLRIQNRMICLNRKVRRNKRKIRLLVIAAKVMEICSRETSACALHLTLPRLEIYFILRSFYVVSFVPTELLTSTLSNFQNAVVQLGLSGTCVVNAWITGSSGEKQMSSFLYEAPPILITNLACSKMMRHQPPSQLIDMIHDHLV